MKKSKTHSQPVRPVERAMQDKTLEQARAEIEAEGRMTLAQRQALEALQESEERYRSLVEAAPDVIYTISGEDGTLTSLNPAFEAITGWPRAQWLGKPFAPLVHPDDLPLAEEAFRKAFNGQTLPIYELRILAKSGEYLAGEFTSTSQVKNGKVVGELGIARDITERKRAEEALREREEFSRALFEHNPIETIVVDREGKVTMLNLARKRSGGRLPNIGDVMYKDYAGKHERDMRGALMECIHSGQSKEFPELKYQHKVLSITISPFPKGAIIISQDITERKRAEDELRKSIQLLHDTGEMARVGAWEIDLSTKEVLMTEEVCRIHVVEPGYKPKLEEALSFYAPESIPALEAALKKVAETGEPYDLESLFIPSGGKEKSWVRSLGRAVYSGGKIAKLAGTFQNIDKYKRAEEALRVSLEKYKVLFESFPLSVTISDKSGKIIEANRQSEQLLGITCEVQTQRRIDSKEWQIIRKDGTPMPADEYASTRALRENRLIENVEMGIVKDKGEITWISVTAAPIPLEGYGVAIAYGDITERKRAERELQEKSAALEHFTHAISHDLRSPLVTVKTFLGYLEQDLLTSDTGRIEKDMFYIRAAADKMAQMLDELLRVLRIGRITNSPVRVTFRELVEEALNIVAGPIAERGVKAQVNEAPITLYGDHPRLVEIWQNLVDNAVKFMGDQASPRIEIGAERRGGDTVFFVRDNGMGIDPPHQPKVFDLFVKIGAKSEGAGLGLALIKRIVELYRGTIWLESKGLGQGACFLFTLPGAVENPEKGEKS
ncbi:MAG: PAS domain S-box protein [Candidatus Sumerlaeota bacterium]|nr:PAS domain S-box protein [Candidatus Sumerlaeota bacterium]